MAATLADLAWQAISTTTQWGLGHVTRRIERAAGLREPPAPPTPPTVQTLTPPVLSPPVIMLPAGFTAGPGLAPPWVPAVTTPQAATTAAVADDPRDRVGDSYSDGIPVGHACLACSRQHLTAVLGAARKAEAAAKSGDQGEAARQWALAASELDAMVAWDWSPEKLAATPAADRAVVNAVQACVATIREALPTPRAAALVVGATAENKRFASSRTFTGRDAAEIETRWRTVDEELAVLERLELPTDRRRAAQEAAEHLREGRHLLDRAQDTGRLYQPEAHQAALLEFQTAAALLTPAPSPKAATALTQQCQVCSDTFYRAYFQSMRARQQARA